MLSNKISFWLLIISCFVGEALTIRILDLFTLFPLRVIILLTLPVILFKIKRRRKGIISYSSKVFFVMFGYGTISLVWSPDPALGLRSISMFLTGLLIFFFISRYIIHLSVLKKIMVIWSIMSLVAGLLGLYEMASGNYIFIHVTDLGATNIEQNRILEIGWLTPRSFFPGPNEFAFFNALSSLVLIGWMFQTRGNNKKLAIVALFITIFLLIYSFSRAAIGGFIIGLSVFFYVLSSKTKIIYRVLTFLFILTSGLYISLNAKNIINNNIALSLLKYKIENQDNSTRLFYANSAIYNGTFGSLGFGKGLGASTEIIKGGSYHSYLLEVLAEYGFWIFLAYVLVLVKVCIQQLNAIKNRRNIYWSAGVLASCVAFPALCSGPATIIALYPYWLWLSFIVGFSEYDSIIASSLKNLNINN